MNPPTPYGHHPGCPARGPVGQGTIQVPSQAAPRDRWTTWGQTFATTQGTPFDRVHPAADVVTRVFPLRCHGCPRQAMVAACGVAERTVAAWVARAGPHGQPVHQPLVHHGRVDVPHVQADARWVQLVGRRAWMARAMAVPSRRWLGGVIRPRRDLVLITTLVPMGRASAWTLALLVGVDGLASDVTACLRVFRPPVRTSRRGRPGLVLEPGVLLGPGVTRYVPRPVVSVERRVVRGTNETIAAGLAAPHRGTGSKTADRERRKATVRASLAPLGRRGRAIAHPEAALTAGLWRVGGAYHVCWRPQRLRLAAPAGAPWPWQERTPAMAAGLTEQRWTRLERLRDQGPPPVWVAPTRRGRPPKRARQPAMGAAT